MMHFTTTTIAICAAIVGYVGGHPTGEGADLVAADFTGRGTIYYQLGAFGSCGQQNSDSAMIVALAVGHMKGDCGKVIHAKNNANGKTVVATVADTCSGCGPNDVDFSEAAWNALTDRAPPGVIEVTWNYQ